VPSLYESGWRQGSVVRCDLATHATIVENDEVRQVVSGNHNLWLIVTQDCDLHRLQLTNNQPKVELRPLLVGEPAPKVGIRSRLHRISQDHPEYVDNDRTREMASAASLTKMLALDDHARDYWLDDHDLAALQTWLGRRYNRPAVPDHFGPLMNRIAVELETCDAETLAHVRSIHAAIEAGEPLRVSLYALMDPAGIPAEIEAMLAEAMLEIPGDLGVIDAIEGHFADTMTLRMLEDSYEVDASDLTWAPN
jgi:hypothetical protein